MAIRPDQAVTLAKSTREFYAEAEALLLQRLARALASGREDGPEWVERKLRATQRLLSNIDGVLADIADGVPGSVERAVSMAYNRGSAQAAGDMEAAGLTAGIYDEVPAASPGVEAIVADTVDRLEPMRFQIRRSVSDIYQQTISRTAAQVNTGALTRREASRLALTRLADQGITGFKDASGRNWEMASYAEQAVRTATMNASLQGSTDRLQALGMNLVMVSNSSEECDLCRPFENKVLSLDGSGVGERLSDGKTVVASLSEAKSKGLYHNNCRHSHSVYIPGITKARNDTADKAGHKLRVKQRAYERRMRTLKRRKIIAAEYGGTASRKANAELRAAQSEFKAWREANDRKTLSYRTSLTAR